MLKCDCSLCQWNKKQVQIMHEAVGMAQIDCLRLARYYQSELERIQIEYGSKPNTEASDRP